MVKKYVTLQLRGQVEFLVLNSDENAFLKCFHCMEIRSAALFLLLQTCGEVIHFIQIQWLCEFAMCI